MRMVVRRGPVRGIVAGLLGLGSLIGTQSVAAQSALAEENVLVVYNSQDADSLAVFAAYQLARPGVLGFDLNDSALQAGNISYDNFISQIRNPLRDFLTTTPAPGGADLTQQVQVITLTKGIPTRIADLNETFTSNTSVGLLGDSPPAAAAAFDAQNATFASVDSELTLLFQDLEVGEAGGAFDSGADNVIVNPFFNASTSIAASDRSTVQDARTFAPIATGSTIRTINGPAPADGSSSAFDTGAVFLTARLDGDTVADVVASIGRAQNVVFNTAVDQFVIDEFDSPGTPELDAGGISPLVRTIDAGGDFDQLALDLTARGFAGVIFDESEAFLVGNNGTVSDPAALDDPGIDGPIAALITFGGNHSTANQNGFIATFFDDDTASSQFIDGAVFTSIESFNARDFGGLAAFGDQGTVAEFLEAGGTFGVGTVFEPFTLGVNEADILLDRFLDGELTFVEAAFASIPFISGNSIIIGDPLARATVIPEPTSMLLLLGGFAAAGLTGRRTAWRSTRGTPRS